MQNTSKEKKSAPIWLWIIGWIVIFPIPLTILMLKNQKIKSTIKYGVIAVAWVVFFIIASVGNGTSGSNDTEQESQQESGSMQDVEDASTTESEKESEKNSEEPSSVEELKYFPSDATVNQFFVNYNAIADIPIEASEIEKGNIRTKALVYIDDLCIEVINATEYLSVSIEVKLENEESRLLPIFSASIKAMVPDVSEKDISNTWEKLHDTEYMVDDYNFNGVKISYVPAKSTVRIDLEFPKK